MPHLVVAGGGMAGLVAAAQARELGAEVVVQEKLDRAGGSMVLSSGVVWRHREWERFRAECPGGDPELPDDSPVVLAPGGFPASRELLRRHVTPEADGVMLRAAPGNTGDGIQLA